MPPSSSPHPTPQVQHIWRACVANANEDFAKWAAIGSDCFQLSRAAPWTENKTLPLLFLKTPASCSLPTHLPPFPPPSLRDSPHYQAAEIKTEKCTQILKVVFRPLCSSLSLSLPPHFQKIWASYSFWLSATVRQQGSLWSSQQKGIVKQMSMFHSCFPGPDHVRHTESFYLLRQTGCALPHLRAMEKGITEIIRINCTGRL